MGDDDNFPGRPFPGGFDGFAAGAGACGRAMRGGSGGAQLAALLAAALFALAGPLLAEDPARDYEILLAQCVKDKGVDYVALDAGRATLDAFVRSLEAADPGASDPDRIAFWINAYNALVLQQVLDTKCKSVLDERGFFDKRTWKVAGREVTLTAIDKTILPEFKQPLVHFALCPASRAAPPLSASLYRGRDLSGALVQQARAYLGDARQNTFFAARLFGEVSLMFVWYRDEFEAGREGGAVPSLQLFLADYVPNDLPGIGPGELARSLRKNVWQLTGKPYDWSLNEAVEKPRGTSPMWIVAYAVAAIVLLLFGLRAFRTLLGRRAAPLDRR